MNILSPINFHAFFILYTLLIIYRVFYPFIKFISQILSSHCSHFLIQFIPLRPHPGDVGTCVSAPSCHIGQDSSQGGEDALFYVRVLSYPIISFYPFQVFVSGLP